ncbi:kinase-like domain-containing protein [Dactylonectria macrodidyma]|uniref:Kinase-like domain-containing protein n=1 Tax=Dactylonectria macrodidyma TaxID=307937 RepID=A0A9P9FGF3_9HYPO|nr:kinase-like domain-containing protein [Dactylonectria macrodidyma]
MSIPETQPLPTEPEQVTPTWLACVLELGVRSIELTNSVLNATASKLFVTITYEDDNAETARPTHVCLKGGFNPAMLAVEGYRDILITMYTREVNFFNLVAPKLTNMSLPKVWWSGADSQQGILVMDDLNHNGFTFGNPVEDWPLDRVITGVEQLAALHAGTWGMSMAEHPWLTPAYEHVMIGLTMMWDDQVLGADRPPFPDIIKNRERTVAAMKKHYLTKNPKFICLLHGDPHTGNTYIDQAGNPRFLDWQTLHIGSAFHDFAYFVVGALSIENRRAHEVSILGHYLEALANFGGPPFTTRDEDVVKEYHKSAMAGLGWVLTPYDMQTKERVIAMCERYSAAIVDHKAIELVESLPDPE